MRLRLALRRPAMGLALAAMLAAVHAGGGVAGVQDSVFFISADGSNVSFEVRDVPRREVLSRLLKSESVELEWGDSAIADERITGAFKGTVEAVLQRLLAQTDYVVIYSNDGPRPRIARLIIVGKGGAPSQSIELPKRVPAMISAPGMAPMLVPGTPPAPAAVPGIAPPLTPPPAAQPQVPAPAMIAPPPQAPSPTASPHPLAVPPYPPTR